MLTIDPGAAPDAPPLAWTHAALVAAAFQVRLWVPDMQAGVERVLVTGHGGVPAHLAAGPLLATLAAGSLHCLDDPDPSELARVIERDRPTVLVSDVDDLPALVAGGDAARRDLTSLRVVLGIGPPADPGLAERIERRTAGARVRTLFGVPGVVLTHAQPIYGRFVPDTIGFPLTATVACVADPDDLDLTASPGTPGRLLVAGPQRSAGPWVPSQTPPVRGPWQVTEALVTVDDSGVFRHLGTLGDMVRRERTWVSRAAIEAVLESHSGVRRAVVVAGERDESLLAAVVCGRRHRPTADQLRVHCRAHLDSPAVPDDVILLDEIPTTDTGTPAHDVLRALLTEGRAR